jgi:integrase
MKFTVKSIAALQLPPGKKDHIEWDADLPGFGVRLREGGSRNWVFQYALGDKQRRMSIGSAKDKGLSLVDARKTASELHAKVKLGQDPAGQKAESRDHATEIFETIGRRWLTKKMAKDNVGAGTYRHLERHILKYARKLHGLKLAGLSRRTVGAEIEAVGANNGPVAANRMQATLSEFFTWAMAEGYMEQNPLIGRDTFDETPRDRVLSDAELQEIWAEAGDDHYGTILKLLMLTGQREDEMASLRRSEIGKVEVKEARLGEFKLPGFMIDVIDLPAERVKNRRRHIVPLTKPVLAILERQPVRTADDGKVRDLFFGIGQGGFSGWSRCKERLDQRLHAARIKRWEASGCQGDKPPPLPHWTPHDIRRSVDTTMNDQLGVLPHIVEAVQNRVSSLKSGKAGVAGVYNHALYLRERAEALRLWADHIMALVGGNVVLLHQSA